MQLISDRTYTDVLMKTEKGVYGPADLNRVETAVAELAEMAKALDVQDDFVVKLDWTFPGLFSSDEWPIVSQMRRYLGNVSRLCRAVELTADLPVSMENLSWEGANQIERALEQVNARIQTTLQTFRFSGEIFAGEESYL